MSVDKERIDTLVRTLDAAFVFASTPEGFDYWSEVHQHLKALQSRGYENLNRREGERRGVQPLRGPDRRQA